VDEKLFQGLKAEIQSGGHCEPCKGVAILWFCHCEELSDEAIQPVVGVIASLAEARQSSLEVAF
jgi:hypothetical protein